MPFKLADRPINDPELAAQLFPPLEKFNTVYTHVYCSGLSIGQRGAWVKLLETANIIAFVLAI